ncbi:MAG: hypothetical protein DHS20C18_11030 [Saprospiraceae bacterium]|nr:MAG: hypothetical protein DHS20C18_11030 [Saprospiraceae bacterium]
MRLFISVVMCLILSHSIQAQVEVGSLDRDTHYKKKFKEGALNKLKDTETIFIYRETDDLKVLKKVVNEVWKITEISFVPYSEFVHTDLENTSFFSIKGLNVTAFMPSGRSYSNPHTYLSLWMPGKDEEGNEIVESFCRIELHPSGQNIMNIIKMSKAKEKDNILDYIYEEGELRNWKPGFLKNYLKFVNKSIAEGVERWLFQRDKENPELKNLQSATLYVPDYAMIHFNTQNGDESTKQEEADIFKKYPYPYEIINTDDLSNKILESDEVFYYLTYVKSSANKFIAVHNNKTGDIIYSNYAPMSYNIKKSDFKTLATAIKNIAKKK